MFDDVDEAYDEEDLLSEFKEFLVSNNIEPSNFKTIRNQDIDFWLLNRIMASSNIEYLGTDDYKKIYTDNHISKQYYTTKDKNFLGIIIVFVIPSVFASF